MASNPTTRKATGLLVLLFVLGIAIGGLSDHLWGGLLWGSRDARHDHNQLVRDLTRDLSLTPDQQKQLQAILDDTRAKFHAVYEQARPQYEQARQEGRNRIRAILTPEQRPKFEEFVRRLDEQRKKEERR